MTTLSLIGWLGTAIYLLNYAYISLLPVWRKWIFFGGNLIAALCLILSSTVIGSWQAVAVNGFWAMISLLLLIGIRIALPLLFIRLIWVMAGLFGFAIILACFKGIALTISLFGWSSVFIFCCGYLLFSAQHMAPRHYFILNTYAALALMPQLWLDNNWAVFWLEVIWASLSLLGVIQKTTQPHLVD
ncbi:MAG: hypothetical protein KZQ78_06955 [Candidatus Thiodiazotropha sp. (ex Ustalcina ferruginea)]|nr:hypothetical protein [Candidatus Thiodiazotropha sp. (ex Ustalcina ferruginea)]